MKTDGTCCGKRQLDSINIAGAGAGMQPGPPRLEPQGVACGGPPRTLGASEKEVSRAQAPHVSRVGAGPLTDDELSPLKVAPLAEVLLTLASSWSGGRWAAKPDVGLEARIDIGKVGNAATPMISNLGAHQAGLSW